MQRADDRDWHGEKGEIRDHVDTGHDVPDGLVVKAVPINTLVPKGGCRHADQGQKEAERDAPAYEEAKAEEDDFVKHRVVEYASVLEEDGDFGHADSNIVNDD
jgi:hypothetical protein